MKKSNPIVCSQRVHGTDVVIITKNCWILHVEERRGIWKCYSCWHRHGEHRIITRTINGRLKKELKKERPGETRHKKGLLSRSLFLIQKFSALLCKILKADKTFKEYESLRRELPVAYQENWLPLLGSCALFSLVSD